MKTSSADAFNRPYRLQTSEAANFRMLDKRLNETACVPVRKSVGHFHVEIRVPIKKIFIN